jgi:hypothetical protein
MVSACVVSLAAQRFNPDDNYQTIPTDTSVLVVYGVLPPVRDIFLGSRPGDGLLVEIVDLQGGLDRIKAGHGLEALRRSETEFCRHRERTLRHLRLFRASEKPNSSTARIPDIRVRAFFLEPSAFESRWPAYQQERA